MKPYMEKAYVLMNVPIEVEDLEGNFLDRMNLMEVDAT